MYGVIRWRAVLPWRRALPWRWALRQLPLARGVTVFMAPAGITARLPWLLLEPDGASAIARGLTVFMAPAGLTLRLPWLLLDPDGASALNRIRPLFMAKAGLTLTRRVRATETVTIIGKRYASPGITQKSIARRLGP